MPNRTVKRNSVVDLLAKVPVNRGSLLTSIENLLKTIERSESAVMIPTLLRDKCEFDAWELLFVAKILKASILGHVDLVEFYMNHIGLNSSQFAASQTSNTTTPTQNGTSANNNTNDFNNQQQPLSPHSSTNGRQSSPVLSPTGSAPQQQQPMPASPSLSTTSSISSVITQSNGPQQQSSSSSSSSTTNKSSSVSSTSWATANLQQSNSASSSTGGSASSTSGCSTTTTNSSSNGTQTGETVQQPATESDSGPLGEPAIQESLLAATSRPTPQFTRQAQPPSLLQLTTNNNHINSVAAGFTNNTIEQLTNQLSNLQTTNGQTASGSSLDGALSISTTAANQQSANGAPATSGPALAASSHPHPPPAELRPSRSAGCLFRLNSGASSPRTPTTPYPQAETLAVGQTNGLPGDPSAPVKLLLQIEQLKLSISHVTSLLESVVELYKKSIDNLA